MRHDDATGRRLQGADEDYLRVGHCSGDSALRNVDNTNTLFALLQKQFEVSEIQLTCKSKIKAYMRPKITCSSDAERVLRQTWDEDKIELVEQFKVLLISQSSKSSIQINSDCEFLGN